MVDRITKINIGCLFAVMFGFGMGAINPAKALMQNASFTSFKYERSTGKDDISKSVINRSNKGYSFRFKEISRRQALEKIADKTDLTLAYRSGLLNKSAVVSVAGRKMKLKQLVKKVLVGSDLGFRITGSRYLVIFKKKKPMVTGTVVDDDTGRPLKGARMMLVRKNIDSSGDPVIERSTFVNSKGEYNIKNVTPGTYKLIISYLGYREVFEHIVVNKGITVGDFRIKEN